MLLLWVAVKLVVPEDADGDGEGRGARDNLWRAVRIVAIADIVMSLDNVIAIAASAEIAAARVDLAHAVAIKTTLIIFGLATSVPLIVAGSAILMALLERFPILVWAGGALLGWVAGDIMVKDRRAAACRARPADDRARCTYWAAAAGAVFVVGIGWLILRAPAPGGGASCASAAVEHAQPSASEAQRPSDKRLATALCCADESDRPPAAAAGPDRRFRLSARLPVDLRARGRGARRPHHRPRARRARTTTTPPA